MQVKRLAYAMTVVAVVMTSSLGATPVKAGFDDPTISYNFHYFSDVDGVDVNTQSGAFSILAAPNLLLAMRWGHDVVVIPAIDAPTGSQEALDAITTASRPIGNSSDPYEDFVKVRDEVQGTITYGRARASYYVSTESDYFAQMAAIGYNQDFFRNNLNIALGASYGWDEIKPLEDADTPGTTEQLVTKHVNIVATQIVTPTTVVRFGGEFNMVDGLQHDPYRNVYVGGGNVPELHPILRDRWSVWFRGSQYITNRSSVLLDYRYYEDNWGVASHTIGGKLNQYVTEEIVVRYRYRYYTQGAAYFFRDDYSQLSSGISGFQSGDYRLGGYSAHLFGGKLYWFPHGLLRKFAFVQRANLVFGYEHYFNANNFSANVFETGLTITF